MALTCLECGGPVEIYDTNGATYPEPLVEYYECLDCGNETSRVLTA